MWYKNIPPYLQAFLYLVALCTFVATTKSLKLLRFNKKMNVLGYTLLYIARPLMSFMLTMGIIFLAYSHMVYMVYNSLLLEFNSFTYTMGTLFTLMLSKFVTELYDYYEVVFTLDSFCVTFGLTLYCVLRVFGLNLSIHSVNVNIISDLMKKINANAKYNHPV